MTILRNAITGEPLPVKIFPDTVTFRGKQYKVLNIAFIDECGEEFTTTESDAIWYNQATAQYRQEHGIPFPDEIRAVREKYGLSAAAMSEVLGFGANQWRLYEQGEVPSESNGKMIRSIMNPKVMLDIVEHSRASLSEKVYKKAFEVINEKETKIGQWRHVIIVPCTIACIICAFLTFIKSPNDNVANNIISTLCALVTILIGWKIWESVELDKKIKMEVKRGVAIGVEKGKKSAILVSLAQQGMSLANRGNDAEAMQILFNAIAVWDEGLNSELELESYNYCIKTLKRYYHEGKGLIVDDEERELYIEIAKKTKDEDIINLARRKP